MYTCPTRLVVNKIDISSPHPLKRGKFYSRAIFVLLKTIRTFSVEAEIGKESKNQLDHDSRFESVTQKSDSWFTDSKQAVKKVDSWFTDSKQWHKKGDSWFFDSKQRLKKVDSWFTDSKQWHKKVDSWFFDSKQSLEKIDSWFTDSRFTWFLIHLILDSLISRNKGGGNLWPKTI